MLFYHVLFDSSPTFPLQQSQHLPYISLSLSSLCNVPTSAMQAGGTGGGVEPNMTTVKKVRIFQCSVGEPYT